MAIVTKDIDHVRIRRALISVSDKSNLVKLGKFLISKNVKILSTGGTATTLRKGGVDIEDVSSYTGFPEMMNGRVKTLHPRIHGGLLAVRGNESHEKDMKDNGILEIDLVVVNLYPFEKTVATGADFNTCIENIDIGGPSMLRSAAKNHRSVAVVTSVDQYPQLMEEMKENGCTSLSMRRTLASSAFSLTAQYEVAISDWFKSQ
uniref:Bifunctional purine biosynthesis protein ATIC n=1 Tax=Hirondellea gigas TaxID=1518452 RepID=A0A6A7G3K6_9CRUS